MSVTRHMRSFTVYLEDGAEHTSQTIEAPTRAEAFARARDIVAAAGDGVWLRGVEEQLDEEAGA